MLFVLGNRQHDDLRVRTGARDIPGGLNAAPGDADIKQHDVRSALLSDSDGVRRGGAFSHHLNAVHALQHVDDPFAKQRVVVNDGNPNDVHHLAPLSRAWQPTPIKWVNDTKAGVDRIDSPQTATDFDSSKINVEPSIKLRN